MELKNFLETKKTLPGTKNAKPWLIMLGWIFTILGGYLGAIIGMSLAFNQEYRKNVRIHGAIMIIASIIVRVFWKNIEPILGF